MYDNSSVYTTYARPVTVLTLLFAFIFSGLNISRAQMVTNVTPVIQLRLDDYLRSVLEHNESLQAQMLDSEASRWKGKAEYGAFEPQLELSAMREANRRTNNVQEQASLSGQTLFDERNNVYDSGVESLLPTGGKVQLGYTLSDLGNNVNPYGVIGGTNIAPFTQQWQTFVGATFTQPLLRNGGFATTLASLRLAALDSDIGFQQYRRQLMLTITRAESAYWNLYFAQEQLRFFNDSVSVAQDVLDDSRQKLKAGQGAELDVMQAQSDLALRETKRNDAMQNFYDALGELNTLAGTAQPLTLTGPVTPTICAVDAPPETNSVISYLDGYEDALSLNPDYLIQLHKMKQEALRVGVARNQLMPELNLKAAYGYNGLGLTPGESWTVAQSQDYPSWSVGLELNIPLGGNIKGHDLLRAAKSNLQEAYINLKGAQTEIGNRLNTALQKSAAWHQSIQSYQTVVHYNEELLKSLLQQLKAGLVDGHKVLEAEADLLDARQDFVNALVQYRRSSLEVELASGSILKDRKLDVTRDELKRQTSDLVRQYQHSLDSYQN